MKTCPKCGKSYSDPSLNFCLDDGSILTQSNGGGSSLPNTVMINQPRPTEYNQQFGSQSAQQNQFSPPQYQTPQVKKGSKTWLWVVGILGLVVVICGGGFGGLMLLGTLSNNNDNTKWNSNFGVNSSNSNSTKSNTSKTPDDSQTDVAKVDLSKWVQTNSQYGTTEFKNDELYAGAIKKDSYYVLVASSSYKSSDATTKITVRDPAGGDYRLGYGLIINSNPLPLLKDYAFLINAKTGKYRVVSHSPGKEKTVVNWKPSSSIKSGTQENVIEVKDENGQLKFFINGDLVETVSGKDGYAGGVPGIYVGGTAPIAFSNLEIRK